MTSNRNLTRYLLASQALVSFLINAVIVLLTSLPSLLRTSSGQERILMEVVTLSEIRREIVGTSFLLPFLTGMICTPLVWKDVRDGRISGRANSGGQNFLRNPSERTQRSRLLRVLVRSLACGICGLLAVGWPLAKIFETCVPDPQISRTSFVVARTLLIATAGAIVTPMFALRALSDCRSDSSDPS